MAIHKFIFQLSMDKTKNPLRIITGIGLVIVSFSLLFAYMWFLSLIAPSFLDVTNDVSFPYLTLFFFAIGSIMVPLFSIIGRDINRWVDFEWKNHFRKFTLTRKQLFQYHIKYFLNPMLLYLEEEYASDLPSQEIADPPIQLDTTNRELIQKVADRYSDFNNRCLIIIVPVFFIVGPILTSILLLISYFPMTIISYYGAFQIEILFSFVLLVGSIFSYYIEVGVIVVFWGRWLVWNNLLFNLDYRTKLQDTLVEMDAENISTFQDNIEKLKSIYGKQVEQIQEKKQELLYLERLSNLHDKDQESIVWYFEMNKAEDQKMMADESRRQKAFGFKLNLFFWLLGIVSMLIVDSFLK